MRFWKKQKDMNKKIIGITGKSGSGKTTVAKKLGELIPNSKVIEIDTIGHNALRHPNILEGLIKIFGNEILDETGNVNRKKLGNIVFVDSKKMAKLANTTYSYILETITNIVDEAKGVLILDWILLPQVYAWQKCDIKILIEADFPKRKEKVILRDHISESYFASRETTSIDYDKKQFDLIFFNDYSLDTLDSISKKIFLQCKKI